MPTSLFAAMTLTTTVSAVDGLFQRIEVDDAIAVNRQEGRGEAFPFELFDRVEDGVVFDRGGDDVVAPPTRPLCEGSAADGSVVRLTTAAREDDLFRRRARRSAQIFRAESSAR